MAREKAHRVAKAASPVPRPRRAKHSEHSQPNATSQKHVEKQSLRSSPPERPARKVEKQAVVPVKEIPRSKTKPSTVSAAGIFKKISANISTARKYEKRKSHRSHRSHRSPTPPRVQELSLAKEFKDGMEEARVAIDATLSSNFADCHNEFVGILTKSHESDKVFIGDMRVIAEALSSSFANEQVTTSFSRDGKCVTELVEIGKSVAQYKKFIEKETVRLEDNWEQWQNLQDEFMELGVQVLGAHGFHNEEERNKGYKYDQELLDVDHNTRLNELVEEIDDITQKVSDAMRTQEKELDKLSKSEQSRLIKSIWGETL